jgi:hypothetical protein
MSGKISCNTNNDCPLTISSKCVDYVCKEDPSGLPLIAWIGIGFGIFIFVVLLALWAKRSADSPPQTTTNFPPQTTNNLPAHINLFPNGTNPLTHTTNNSFPHTTTNSLTHAISTPSDSTDDPPPYSLYA